MSSNDPFPWLEEVTGQRALSWATQQSDRTLKRLQADPRFGQFEQAMTAIYEDTDRLHVAHTNRDGYAYHFLQDATHVRGLLRRTRQRHYLNGTPRWETVLDVDAIATAEGENWVLSGTRLSPNKKRLLVLFSRGGGDTIVVREFDLKTQTFVTDGFTLPDAKTTVRWETDNTLLVSTDTGPDSLTTSGYPRDVRRWRRGTPFSEATLLFQADVTDVSASMHHSDGVTLIYQSVDFYHDRIFLLDTRGMLRELPLPHGAALENIQHGKLIFTLRHPWQPIGNGGTTYPAGALLESDMDAGNIRVLWLPTPESSLEGVYQFDKGLLLKVTHNVTHRLLYIRRSWGKWHAAQELPLPQDGVITVHEADKGQRTLLYAFENMLNQPALYTYDNRKRTIRVLQSTAPKFDTTGLKMEQRFATSPDGTQVPYFIVGRADMPLDGSNPTLLYGYGGFEVSMEPDYVSSIGKLWLERGGVFVLASIRGGGEYGPKWHQAALKQNRQRAYDDFIAIAEHLISTGVTSPRRLGIHGGSNGGLLMGVMLIQRPELFNAVLCGVPLLDMLRYHKLLAGASWMGEYGDPDNPAERQAIEAYSPYQNIRADATYPEALFYTSTRDDRVHPGHARKMVAKLHSMGHPALFYENPEGGHQARANLRQQATMDALRYVYLSQKLMD